MIHEFINIIKSLWIGIWEFALTKIILTMSSSIFVFAFGVNHAVIMKALIFIIIIDFITGIWSARVSGEHITSRRAVKSAYKLVMYGLLVAGAHLTEVIIPGTTYLEDIVTSFLAVTELISILENAGRMGYAIPKKLLKKLQDYRDEQ